MTAYTGQPKLVCAFLNILRLDKAELAYGEQQLLHNVSFTLSVGEKVALVGRNGSGKTTLLKILHGEVELDDGELWHDPGLNIATLDQELPASLDQAIFEVVSAGLKTSDSSDDWNIDHKVNRIISLLNLPAEQTLQDSSGGIQRRAMLAQALVGEPDLLLLDEPTNHLDIPTIDALQKLLQDTSTTLVLVSHDRVLIDNVASRIIELDRGTLTSYPGNYAQYLARKEKTDAAEAGINRKFDRNLASEEVWIRQGIKARRTRNEGRVRRLQDLRRERAARLKKQGNVNLKLDRGRQSGDLVALMQDVSFAYDRPLISGFTTQISSGDRIGIIGANGSGKSTLIRLILGELTPDAGTTRLGTKLDIAYFDQQRSLLNNKKTVRNNVSEGSDHIEIGGKKKHIVGYLADFLFPSNYLNMPVAKLSGGEKNRLLMAKLFVRPANMLVLDEPTNDLDIETLELFEELLADFAGTILLVSHDRAFLDAVVTSTIVFEADGNVAEYVGGYTDWQQQTRSPSPAVAKVTQPKREKGKPSSNKKLSYNEQRELGALPQQIESLEHDQDVLQALVMEPVFYKKPESEVRATLNKLKSLQDNIEVFYLRWQELSERDG